MEVRVDCDHVDLSERGIHRGVDLRPAESGDAAVDFVNDEPIGIEPRLGHARFQGFAIPSSLFGVMGKRTIVDLEPSRFVASDPEGPHVQLRM